jgi:TetR/AcrR family acrAB operon transcriptional repressor
MYEKVVRRTAEDTAATRAALVDAALFAFARDGVDRATLGGIAEAAGVTRGAVYHHFADKDALLTAVLGETWDVVAAPVWAASAGAICRGSPPSTGASQVLSQPLRSDWNRNDWPSGETLG